MPLQSMTSLLSALNAAIFNASRVIPLGLWLLAGLTDPKWSPLKP